MDRKPDPAARTPRERGMALVVVLSMVVLLTVLVAFALTVSNRDGGQVGKRIHNLTVQNVAEGAMQYARAYFSVNYLKWNTYLALTYPPDKNLNPELFPAVPTDFSCWVYARDDADELPPATPDPKTDNNHTIYIGAVCTGPGNTSAESTGVLIWDASRLSYGAQGSGGTHGINNYAGAGNFAVH